MRFACLLALALPLWAQLEPVALLETKTLARIEAYDRSFDGVLGLAAVDLTTGRSFAYHGDLLTTQASLIKIPILVTAFAQNLDLSKKVTVTAKDAVGGSGTLDVRLKQGPVELTVDELLTLMIRDSDNTATNQIIALVGKDKINALMAKLGLPNTRLRRIMMDSAAAKKDEENTSTPTEMARLVTLIYQDKLAGSKRMIDYLKLVRADFAAALPVPVAAKPGGVPGVHTEAGIVFLDGRPYVLSVMASLIQGEANPLRDIADLVHQHFVRLSMSNRYGHRVAEPLY